MGDIEVDVDVSTKDLVALEDALLDGLKEGMEDSLKWLRKRGKQKAKSHIQTHGRVWNKRVKNLWTKQGAIVTTTGDDYHGTTAAIAVADHAVIVDKGLAPRGEIKGANPSVQDLIPWVSDKLGPSPYGATSGDDSDDGPDDFFRDGHDADGFGQEFWNIESYDDIQNLDLDPQQFNSKWVAAGTLNDDSRAIWKSHAQADDAWTEADAIRNEVLWSRAQEERDWNLGPRSRLDDNYVEGEFRDGTAQEYIADATTLDKAVFLDDEAAEWTGERLSRDQFLTEYRDELARVTALDYLTGNNDRHSDNLVIDGDGNLRAIDNGGMKYSRGLDSQKPLKPFGSIYDYNDAVHPEDLKKASHAFYDEVEEVLAAIGDDPEYRAQLLEWAAEVHGEDSKWYSRLDRAIGEDVGSDHFLHEGFSGTPTYVEHLNERRERVDSWYETYLDEGMLGLLDDTDDDGGFTAGAFDDDGSPVDEITGYQDANNLGISETAFNSEYARAAELEDGTDVIWKSHAQIEKYGSQASMVRNEAVWSYVQETQGWDLGPKSRIDEVELDGEVVQGTAQEFVTGMDDFANHVRVSQFEVDGDPISKDAFLEDYNDWFARVQATDYLVGNEDRHKNNVVIDGDGNPRAIDNGGFRFNDDFRIWGLKAGSEWRRYERADDPSRLHELNMARLDRVEQILDEIANDAERREEIADFAERVHGENSEVAARFRERLAGDPGDDPDHFVNRYKDDVADLREEYEANYNYYLNNDDDETNDPADSEPSYSTDFNFDDKIDELIGDALGPTDEEEGG